MKKRTIKSLKLNKQQVSTFKLSKLNGKSHWPDTAKFCQNDNNED